MMKTIGPVKMRSRIKPNPGIKPSNLKARAMYTATAGGAYKGNNSVHFEGCSFIKDISSV
jgi:hypothetical protein